MYFLTAGWGQNGGDLVGDLVGFSDKGNTAEEGEEAHVQPCSGSGGQRADSLGTHQSPPTLSWKTAPLAVPARGSVQICPRS